MVTPAIEYKQHSGFRCAIHATRGRLKSVRVMRENDNTSHTFLDNEMNKNAMYLLVFTMRGLSSGSGGPVVSTMDIQCTVMHQLH